MSSLVTTPAGRSPRTATSAFVPPDEQGERRIERRRRLHEWQRRVHHLPDRALDDRWVPECPVQEPLLADGSHQADDVVALGFLGDRQLADAEGLERRDRIPDAFRRPGDDDRRAVGCVVAVGQEGVDPRRGPGRRHQAVRAHPLVVVELGEVAPPAVGEEHHDDRLVAAVLGRQFADDLAGRDHRGPARPAGQDPLLAGQSPGHREGVVVAHAHPAIDDGRVVRPRDEVLADALGQVRPGGVPRQDAPLRVGADHLDRRVLVLEEVRHAGDGPAGPDAGHEVGDPAVRLPPRVPGRSSAHGRPGSPCSSTGPA